MRKLRAILERRGPVLHAFKPNQTVQEAVEEMAHHEIGVVTVVENDTIVGIFGERDLVRRVIAPGRSAVGPTGYVHPTPLTKGREWVGRGADA